MSTMQGYGMSLEKDRQEDAKDFPCRRDGRQDEGIKVGNRIKDKRLSHGGTNGKFDNFGRNFRISPSSASSNARAAAAVPTIAKDLTISNLTNSPPRPSLDNLPEVSFP